jgi:predicted transcriptional regulator
MSHRDEETPLENENRRRVFDLIRANPGLHAGELERRSTLPTGTLAYHLQYLEQVGLVEVRQEEYFKRYYAAGEVGRPDRDLLRLLRQQIPRRILGILLLSPALTHADISQHFDLSAPTISYHLGKLVKANQVVREGRFKGGLFRLVDRDAIARALVAYRSSFLDNLIDRVVETWLEAHP